MTKSAIWGNTPFVVGIDQYAMLPFNAIDCSYHSEDYNIFFVDLTNDRPFSDLIGH